MCREIKFKSDLENFLLNFNISLFCYHLMNRTSQLYFFLYERRQLYRLL